MGQHTRLPDSHRDEFCNLLRLRGERARAIRLTGQPDATARRVIAGGFTGAQIDAFAERRRAKVWPAHLSEAPLRQAELMMQAGMKTASDRRPVRRSDGRGSRSHRPI